MADIDSEILRKVVEYNYKDEVIEMSGKLREKVKQTGHDKTLYLYPEINGKVFGKDDDEIINIMAQRIIQYKILEKSFETLVSEGLLKPSRMCDDTCSISKDFKKRDGTAINGKFGFRRIIYDEFIIV